MKGLDIHKVPFVFFQNSEKSKEYSTMLKKHVLNESAPHANLLSDVFFSKDNLNMINKGIILTVFKVTKGQYYIGNQSNKHYEPKTNICIAEEVGCNFYIHFLLSKCPSLYFICWSGEA